MKRLIAVPLLLLFVASCQSCERAPSELVPGFDSLLLPSNFCTGENDPIELQIRNAGDDPVTISKVSFEAVDGRDADLENFDAPTTDTEKLLADETVFVRFTYRTPGGVEQKATLVIESDAAENPVLKVPVVTQEFVGDPDLCGEGEGEGDVGEGEGDVGEGEGDVGEGEGEGDAP